MRALLFALVVSIGGCGTSRTLVTKTDRVSDAQVKSPPPPAEDRFAHDHDDRR
jgi:hypothetical protein